MANHLLKMINTIVQLPDAALKVRSDFQVLTCLKLRDMVIYVIYS